MMKLITGKTSSIIKRRTWLKLVGLGASLLASPLEAAYDSLWPKQYFVLIHKTSSLIKYVDLMKRGRLHVLTFEECGTNEYTAYADYLQVTKMILNNTKYDNGDITIYAESKDEIIPLAYISRSPDKEYMKTIVPKPYKFIPFAKPEYDLYDKFLKTRKGEDYKKFHWLINNPVRRSRIDVYWKSDNE